MRRDRMRFFASAFFSLFVTAAVLSTTAAATTSAAMSSVEGGEDMAAAGRMVQELFDSGVPHSETAVLSAIYGDAQERFQAIILKPKGTKLSSQEWYQARAAEQIAQVRRIVRGLGQPTVQWTGTNVGRAFREGIVRGEEQAKAAGVRDSFIRGSFHQIDPRTVDVFARQIVADLNRAMNAAAANAEYVIRQTAQMGLAEREISSLLAQGAIEGRPRETTRALRDALVKVNNGNVVPIRTKTGGVMHMDARRYAETVVRTQTRAATVLARHERLQSLDIDLVAIVGAQSVNPCSDYLGTVWSLSGRHPKFPSYAEIPGGGPPWHPNCSKSTRPFVEDLADPDQLKAADLSPDQRNLLGTKDWQQLVRAHKDLQIGQQRKGTYAGPVRAATAKETEAGVVVKSASATPPPPAAAGAPKAPASSAAATTRAEAKTRAKTEQLRRQLEEAKQARQAAEQQLAQLRASVEADRQRLAELLASNAAGSAEVAALQQKIAAADAVAKAYDRRVKRVERRA